MNFHPDYCPKLRGGPAPDRTEPRHGPGITSVNMRYVMDSLSDYAMERQYKFMTQHRDKLEPEPEARNNLIRAVLHGITELGLCGPSENAVKKFDQRLAEGRQWNGMKTIPTLKDKVMMTTLRRYIKALDGAAWDTRERLIEVSDLLEDMSVCPWDDGYIGLSAAREETDTALIRATVFQPIRFTRLALYSSAAVAVSDFVAGIVSDEEAVKQTELYRECLDEHPEIGTWTVACGCFAGNYGSAVRDAAALDVEIMRRYEDRFLNAEGVRFLGALLEMTVNTDPAMEHSPSSDPKMSMG